MNTKSVLRLCAGGLLVAAALSVAQGAGTPQTADAKPAAAPAGHKVAFGMDVLNKSGQSRESAVTKAEKTVGRKLAFTRDFLLWDSAFPTSYEKWLGARGTTPLVSVKAMRSNGSSVPWASIAAAKPGSAMYNQIKSWGQRLHSYGHHVYFTFNHEPEAKANLKRGSAADFVAAWRKIHTVFASVGATNVRYLWIMTSWAFQVPASDRRYAAKWYPGDSYVNAIGADAYNWGTCSSGGGWGSLAQVISGFMAFGKSHPSTSMWLPEFGTVEGSAGRKAQWIAATEALLKQPAYSRVVGVSYYNDVQPGEPCNWLISSSASATKAMKTLADDSFFAGAV